MKRILTSILFVLFSSVAFAQLDPTVTTTADGVHYQGAWSAGTTETALVTARTSSESARGYVNTTNVGGIFHLYSAAGFNSYLGTVGYEPTKALDSFLRKVAPSISTDYVRFSIHGDVGETVPSVGNPFITGGAGGEVDIALTQSGSLVWTTIYAGWQNPGVVIVKSGLQYYFGASSTSSSTQSAKSAKVRRALAKLKVH